jgi:hypothetical protein
MFLSNEIIVEVFGFLSVVNIVQFLVDRRLLKLKPFAQLVILGFKVRTIYDNFQQIKKVAELISDGKKLFLEKGNVLTHTAIRDGNIIYFVSSSSSYFFYYKYRRLRVDVGKRNNAGPAHLGSKCASHCILL